MTRALKTLQRTDKRTINTSARQRLVNTEDVEGVDTDPRWKESSLAVLVTHLLAQIRTALRASLESCSYSLETR